MTSRAFPVTCEAAAAEDNVCGAADRLWNFVQDRNDRAEVLQSLTGCRLRRRQHQQHLH